MPRKVFCCNNPSKKAISINIDANSLGASPTPAPLSKFCCALTVIMQLIESLWRPFRVNHFDIISMRKFFIVHYNVSLHSIFWNSWFLCVLSSLDFLWLGTYKQWFWQLHRQSQGEGKSECEWRHISIPANPERSSAVWQPIRNNSFFRSTNYGQACSANGA